MMREPGRLVYWVVAAGLVGILGMGGCSKKNVMATTSGAEVQQAGKGTKADSGSGRGSDGAGGAGSGGIGETRPGGVQPGGDAQAKADTGAGSSGGSLRPDGNGPLKGFGKTPSEESVQAPPTMVAKVDQAEIDARRAREAAKRELKDIYFAFDRWALSSEGKKNLAESADFLKQNPSTKLLIEGHCDERGSREYNLVLGEKRAKEVRRYLADLGIKNLVSINSFGKERPVCAEHDESCYWKNRRAHLAVETGP